MKSIFISIAFITMQVLNGSSQVIVIPPLVSPFFVTPESITSAQISTIENISGATIEARLSDVITGQVLLQVNSSTFNLTKGMNSLAGKNLGLSTSYGSDENSGYLRTHHQLPGGKFNLCISFKSNSTEETITECELIESETNMVLSLIYPSDRDTIDTSMPLLNWLHSGSFINVNQNFVLTLAEVKDGQSSGQAIKENSVVYTRSQLKSHSIPYPPSAEKLIPGKTYAWQIELWENDRPILSSEIWSFHVRLYKPEDPIKYVKLRTNKNAGDYRVVDERVYFMFEDGGSSSGLVEIVILDETGKAIISGKNNDQVSFLNQQNLKQLALDIGPYKLQRGQYLLKLYNNKGEKFELNLYVD